MSKQLILVRHGNTFLPNQTPTRVGRKTDLPLVENEKAKAVGQWLSNKNIIPNIIYAAPLLRTMQTVEIIKATMHLDIEIIRNDDFLEIDYGPDENKTEDEVKRRLGKISIENDTTNFTDFEILNKGKSIIQLWDEKAIVPQGWTIDINLLINNWISFAQNIPDNTNVLVCSSNGVIRFAPHILGADYLSFVESNNLKVATGSISIFSYEQNKWVNKCWNLKP